MDDYDAQGAWYTKSFGSKNFSINKYTGKLTVKKGTKKGTYTLKIKVLPTGNESYKAGEEQEVTVKIKVK
jgi:hypothetical protein